MICTRCYDADATRNVRLTSSVVEVTRAFCDECAHVLCAAVPVAGVTSSASGIREPLIGTDLGPISRGAKDN